MSAENKVLFTKKHLIICGAKTFIFSLKNGKVLRNMTPVASDTRIEIYIRCKKRGIEFFASTKDNLTSCKGGVVSAGGFKDVIKVLSKPENYREIQI